MGDKNTKAEERGTRYFVRKSYCRTNLSVYSLTLIRENISLQRAVSHRQMAPERINLPLVAIMKQSSVAEERLKNHWLENKKRLLKQIRSVRGPVFAGSHEVIQYDWHSDHR
ncbi:hypothetical protein [Novipirellula rosea]